MGSVDDWAIKLYSGPVQTFFHKSGLHPYLQSVRYRMWLANHGRRSEAWNTFRGTPTPTSELPLVDDFLDESRSGDVFYDLGAFKGAISILAAQASDCSVIAFEPNPENAEELRNNRDLNAASNKIEVHEVALADENTAGELELQREHSSDRLATNSESETIPIEITKGDDYIEKHDLPRPDIVKIDIEGAEARALRGLEKTIQNEDCRVIYCEIHHDKIKDYGDSPEEVRDLLETAGFTLERVHSRREAEFVKAHR